MDEVQRAKLRLRKMTHPPDREDATEQRDAERRRSRILRDIERGEGFPVLDSDDETLILSRSTRRGVEGYELAQETVVRPPRGEEPERCPECGHDRYKRAVWQAPGGVEHGEKTECVGCGHILEEFDTF